MKTAVRDIMSTQVVAVKRGATFKEMAARLRQDRVSAFPVVDDDGFLITMVSDRSVGICAYTQGKALTQIPVTCGATERVEVVRTGDSLEFAHELMRKHHVRCLPVVEATGRLIGLLSITDVIGSTSLQGEPRLSANSVEAKAIPR